MIYTEHSISVAQFNVLADYLSDAFPHIKDKKLLSWSYRKPLLLQELHQLNADVICMEEVDHFEDFQTDLVQSGYSGIFKKKLGSGLDGCALFWKSAMYSNVLIFTNII
jgi:mRNA deadenylase 3'-5' endonuclease subunit Ccr4